MSIQILFAVMHQNDYSLLDKMNLSTNAVVINQCDTEGTTVFNYKGHAITWVNSKERGLSRSRNLAIENASSSICLIADDDEVFENDLNSIIEDGFNNQKDADVLIFRMTNHKDRFPDYSYRLKKLDSLKVSSCQIAFKLDKVRYNIIFDTNLGAGTNNGGGEENKFILDCIRKGLKVFYCPVSIASVAQEKSTWFNGFDEVYFYNRGRSTRYILGQFLSVLYAIHFLVFKYKLYKSTTPLFPAGKAIFKGIFQREFVHKYYE